MGNSDDAKSVIVLSYISMSQQDKTMNVKNYTF